MSAGDSGKEPLGGLTGREAVEADLFAAGGQHEFAADDFLGGFGDEFEGPNEGDEFAGKTVGRFGQAEPERTGFAGQWTIEADGFYDAGIFCAFAAGQPEQAQLDGARGLGQVPSGGAGKFGGGFEGGAIVGDFYV